MPWRRGRGLVMMTLSLTSVPRDHRERFRPNYSIMKLAPAGALKVQYGPVAVFAYTSLDLEKSVA